MKREFVKNLLNGKVDDKEMAAIIDAIMDENSSDIGAEKAKVTAAEAKTKEAETAKATAEAKVTTLEVDNATLKTASQGTESMQNEIATLKAAATEFDGKLKAANVSAAVKIAMAGKVHDVDIASALVDVSKIEFDEKGSIKNGLNEQLEALQKDKAFLFKQEAAPAGNQNPSGYKPHNNSTPPGQGGNSGGQGGKTLGDAIAAAMSAGSTT